VDAPAATATPLPPLLPSGLQWQQVAASGTICVLQLREPGSEAGRVTAAQGREGSPPAAAAVFHRFVVALVDDAERLQAWLPLAYGKEASAAVSTHASLCSSSNVSPGVLCIPCVPGAAAAAVSVAVAATPAADDFGGTGESAPPPPLCAALYDDSARDVSGRARVLLLPPPPRCEHHHRVAAAGGGRGGPPRDTDPQFPCTAALRAWSAGCGCGSRAPHAVEVTPLFEAAKISTRALSFSFQTARVAQAFQQAVTMALRRGAAAGAATPPAPTLALAGLAPALKSRGSSSSSGSWTLGKQLPRPSAAAAAPSPVPPCATPHEGGVDAAAVSASTDVGVDSQNAQPCSAGSEQLIESEASAVPVQPIYTCLDPALVPWPEQTTHLCHLVLCRPPPPRQAFASGDGSSGGSEPAGCGRLLSAIAAAAPPTAGSDCGESSGGPPRVVQLPARGTTPPLVWRAFPRCSELELDPSAAATARDAGAAAGVADSSASTPTDTPALSSLVLPSPRPLPPWWTAQAGYGRHLSLAWMPPVEVRLDSQLGAPPPPSRPAAAATGADARAASSPDTAGPEQRPCPFATEPWVVLTDHASLLPRQIASIVKIITAYVVLRVVAALEDYIASAPDLGAAASAVGLPCGMSTLVLVSRRAASLSGTSAKLSANEALSITSLLAAMLLPSGNDAATALAEHFGRYLRPVDASDWCPFERAPHYAAQTWEREDPLSCFVAEMNRAAAALG
jgi:hypothetical protein